MHDGTMGSSTLYVCTMEGGLGGRNQKSDSLVDSLPEIIHSGIVEMMRTIDLTIPMVNEQGKGVVNKG